MRFQGFGEFGEVGVLRVLEESLGEAKPDSWVGG